METSQQIILLLLGIGIGLVAGVIIGILIQRSREQAPAELAAQTTQPAAYGSVDPGSIHTLPTESEAGRERQVCPVCGHENPPDNIFCQDCGGRLH